MQKLIETWQINQQMNVGFGNHSIRSERWRYIRYNDGGEEVYDHNPDPFE